MHLTGYVRTTKQSQDNTRQAVPTGDTCAAEREYPLSAKKPAPLVCIHCGFPPTPLSNPNLCFQALSYAQNVPTLPSEAGDRDKKRNAGHGDGEPGLPPQGRSWAKSSPLLAQISGELLT